MAFIMIIILAVFLFLAFYVYGHDMLNLFVFMPTPESSINYKIMLFISINMHTWILFADLKYIYHICIRNLISFYYKTAFA